MPVIDNPSPRDGYTPRMTIMNMTVERGEVMTPRNDKDDDSTRATSRSLVVETKDVIWRSG